MDIGTAKPTPEDQQLVRHHLLDIRDPDESFSAAEFKHLARQAIDDIASRGKLPVIAGGTGLYVDAVLFDYQFGPSADERLRAQLTAMTVEELQNLCRQKGIELPVNTKNKRHLIRAVELGGLPAHPKNIRTNTLVVGLTSKKEKLRERIEKRVQEMVRAGVLGETKRLGDRYGWEGEALKGNIYRIFRGVVEDTTNIATATEECVRSDMALAKRQITWFKRNPAIVWSEDAADLRRRVDTFLRQQA
jgi:tRNA dimethylallyltransferase